MRHHVLLLALLLVAGRAAVGGSVHAPADERELEVRLDDLRQQFSPFLRTLPAPLPARSRTRLPVEWRFTHESKETPKTEGIPPAPEWFGPGFDDRGWETTTVPEWRYRTREGDDTARQPDKVDVWKNTETTADTICWYRTTFPGRNPAPGGRLWLCFEGVEWEAQVWLNGELLGTHRVYYEPFHFDITGRLREKNTLAVRVLSGRSYGQPMTYWGLFPDIRAAKQRYVPDRTASIPGQLPIGYHAGCGYGIFRDVFIEETGPARISAVFARNDLSDGQARVGIELEGAPPPEAEARVEILPENFEGEKFSGAVRAGPGAAGLTIPMPQARLWSPDHPWLYRCRVTVPGCDARDEVFGCRSFTVHHGDPLAGLPTYSFAPVKARWLRILGRGSDRTPWNSIWEVRGLPLAKNAETVTASRSHPDYPARLAVDGKADTRWAVEGRGEWIQFALDESVALDHVSIGWFEAASRKWDFDLLVSDDGRDWRKLDYQPQPAAAAGRPDGLFLLNGVPCYLRGTNIQGLNVYWYWGQKDELLKALLLLKAGNFNAVRSCQHVEFPEVLDLMDRVGILSEQDQGGGYRGSLDTGLRRDQHIHTGTVLARQTYNHPGVVLLCFGNEHDFPTEPIVRAALAVDPQRVFKPISGRISHSRKPWDLPEDLRANAVDDSHPYSGWYGGNVPQTWRNLQIFPSARLITLGEFGAEALDAYETMRDHYPSSFRPPPPETDTLWAASQVQKQDLKQIVGLGRPPKNLAEFIEASQNYQESLLADKVIGMRLSPGAIGGYFQFHFLDVVPAFWPKSIVSHDQRPKKAYYQMAQLNQPLVPLPQLTGDRPDAMTLWVANDLEQAVPGAMLEWKIEGGGRPLLAGRQKIDVPALGAVNGPTIDLLPVSAKERTFDIDLTLAGADGKLLSSYRRNIRVVPRELLAPKPESTTPDPFRK